MGKEWDSFKETGSSKHFHSPDTETARGFGALTGGTPIKALPRFNSSTKEYQAWCKVWARALFRAMRSGAHILVFGGTRTVHRLTCALEDAGFEIRDMLSWVYGSGFPKGLSVSKAIDKKFGLEQPVIGRQKTARPIAQGDYERIGKIPMATNEKDGSMSNPELQGVITQPISPEAQYWEGWNTVLKPAHEPIMLARKPISESSVVEHVLKHGIGAINIGECRVEVNSDVDAIGKTTTRGTREAETWRDGSGFKNEENAMAGVLPSGRYPANLILSHHPDCKLIQEGETSVKDVSTHASSTKLGRYGIYGDYDVPVNMRHSFVEEKPEIWECVDDCPVRMLNEQSGDTKYAVAGKLDLVNSETPILGSKGIYGLLEGSRVIQRYGGSGGAARFFYCPKPSQKERNLGLGRCINCEVFVVSGTGKCQLEGNITLGKRLVQLSVGMAQLQSVGIEGYGIGKKSTTVWNTVLFGKTIMEKYKRALKSVIKTSTHSTMTSRILNYLTVLLTKEYMADVKSLMESGGSHVKNVENPSQYLLITISAKMASLLGVSNVVSGTRLIIRLQEEACRSSHVTVKPIALMRYLVRLITPFGGVVADPFLGTGTTAIAAEMEGFQWVGCDNNKDYCDIARARIEAARKQARAEP